MAPRGHLIGERVARSDQLTGILGRDQVYIQSLFYPILFFCAIRITIYIEAHQIQLVESIPVELNRSEVVSARKRRDIRNSRI